MTDLSVIIPSRNEEFLTETVDDVLSNARGDTEVIVICDGGWPIRGIKDRSNLHMIYHKESIGQRAATNEGVKLSRAKYIMKLDAHCSLDEGFDVKLMQDCEPTWTVVPRQYNLHVFNWKCLNCGEESYQGPTPNVCDKCHDNKGFEKVMVWKIRKSRKSDSWRFDKDLIFQYWRAYNNRPEGQGDITDTMSLLGACYFMERGRFWEIGGLDEDHGSWGQMGTEIACKSWLSGGRLCTNKKTWFAHMFRTGNGFSFPYPLRGKDVQRARKYSKDLWLNGTWPGAKHDLQWLVDKFAPVPDWS